MRVTAGDPAIRRAHRERAIGEHEQSDAIVIRCDDFGEPRSDVRVEAEAIQLARAHAAEAAGVDGDEHVEDADLR